MSKVFIPNRRARRGVRTSTLRMQVNIGLVSLVMVMLGLITIMGLVSLTSLNAQATMGYEIERLEAERQEFVEDGELNDMLILQARSLDTIMESDVVVGMVRADSRHIAYVEPIVTIASSAY
ncbi:MAG: hypothetical protein ABII07_03230 [Patescibacteria group bacterium]|nr:hypothetical protein [Patescibacteria group bacterium]